MDCLKSDSGSSLVFFIFPISDRTTCCKDLFVSCSCSFESVTIPLVLSNFDLYDLVGFSVVY